MRFAVLGAGLMGRAVIYDLAKAREAESLLVADFDRKRAAVAAREFGRGKAKAVFADVRDLRGTAQVLRGTDIVINCTQYDWNLHVMKAALAAHAHYLDLGGLYHMTRRQSSLDSDFRRAGLLAIIGMGGAPGATNIMARAASRGMERVESIRVYNAGADQQHYSTPMAYSFSIATILDELTMPPVTFEKGRFAQKDLLSDPEEARFPAPIGKITLRNSLHSEVGTLPLSFRNLGVREVRFKINYAPEFVSLVRGLTALGLTSPESVPVNGTRVAPREVLLSLLKRRPPEKPARDVEAMRVVVTGVSSGHGKAVAMEAWTSYTTRPSFSAVARDTGFPASIAAIMMARGEIRGSGVAAPENIVPPGPFFRELEKRDIRIRQWSIRPPRAHSSN
jgi:saccharopine dehydrogenase-like NADP-dependent oxidoreductase